MNTELIESIGSRGENLLEKNLHKDETVLVKLGGSFGEALVMTNKHVYIIKWGLMTHNVFGGNCNAFDYGNIVGLEIKRSLINGTVEVLTAANKDVKTRQSVTRRSQGGNPQALSSIAFFLSDLSCLF